MIYKFKTKDHPEANGRLPKAGEQMWSFKFGLEDGAILIIEGGKVSQEAFQDFFRWSHRDDVIDTYNKERGCDASFPELPEGEQCRDG